jgi:flavorubredoxin
MKKAAVIYISLTGNTEKVAESIQQGLIEGGIQTSLLKLADAGEVDLYDFDLICLGTPSHSWLPPKAMDEYLRSMFNRYKQEGRIRPGAPALPGKCALIFCTYSGPHTGIREAIPVGKYVGQFFEHLGFTVIDEWYVLSEFHGSEENSTLGRMGNIKGLPNKDDLERLKNRAVNLARRL